MTSTTETELFTVQGVQAELLGITNLLATGLVPLNQRGYLDVRFTATTGATLNEATILDAGQELVLSGAGAAEVTLSGVPTALGDGVYRYSVTGQFAVGEVKATFAAGSVTDSSGIKTAVKTTTFFAEA